MSEFDRSNFMRERHRIAREQRKLYMEKLDKSEKPNYFDFLKNETPLEREIVSYLVSFQVSYTGRDSIISTPQTFVVYGFKGQESEIQKKTMNMVVDSKGKKTNSNFHPNTIEAVEDNTNVMIKPRGLEHSSQKLEHNKVRQFVENGYYVEGLDTELTFKNKKNREGKMNLDLRHFQ